jgi:hypothetical protein
MPGHWRGAGYRQQPAVYQEPVYQPPPQPVYQPPQPVYQQPVQEYYQPPAPIEVQYEAPPPPPQYEVIPVAPSPNHLWIAGHWGWQGGRHYWNPGRYEVRRVGMQWRAASWQRNGRGWRYAPGHWYR